MSKYLKIALIFLLGLTNMTSWAGKPVTNKPPAVSLTSPVNGATYTAPASIVLTASATDTDGTIAKVEFYSGTTIIGTSSISPYTLTWNNVTGGAYSLKAVATDNSGASTTSTTVGITVTGSKVLISAPANGSTLYGGTATVTGTFTGDASSTVLVDNGNSSRLATLNSNTYTAYLPLFTGPNTLTVSVARTDKTSDKASVTVTGGDYPKIAFRSPTSSTFNAPANLLFDVDAVSPSGTISKVEFYTNGTLASTVNALPYQYALLNALAKSYTIQAKATDSLGLSSYASTTVTGLGPNILPTATLTSPLNGAVYTAPANIALTVNASDSDGSITLVEFFQNGALLGSTNISPYSFNWINVPTGTYTLTAKATDDRAGTVTSAPVTVSVTPPNTPPTVSLTSPTAGATFYSSATIALSADAADSDGTITKVEFYQGTTLVGTATSAPYTANWTNVAAGSYLVTAKATDNLGSVATSAPVTVTVIPNAPPTVSLTSPTADFNAYAPAIVTLSANAADSDGAIAKVDFYQGTTLIGTVANAPYTTAWAAATAGTYALTAVATDNLGAAATSLPVTITVMGAQLAISTPASGATLTGNSVQVSGAFQGPLNPGITVNGAVASVDGSNFYANVPLVAGANTLMATLTLPTGQTSTQSIVVNSDGLSPALQISVDNLQGIVPFKATFSLQNTGTVDLTVQFNGGSQSIIPTGGTATAAITLSNAGAAPITVTATDANGNITIQNYVLVAIDPVQMDQLLRGIHSGMLDKLKTGDIDGAMLAINGSAHDTYLAIFTQLKPHLADIVNQFGTLLSGSFNERMAEYQLVRDTPEGKKAFDIYFLRGEDGVWRIDGM